MTVKQSKTIGILFLSIIYILSSCLISFTFADTADACENITPGKYYIQNKRSGLFMGGLDFCSVIHTPYNTDMDLQKWELEYVENGYYRVKNVYSGYYLTAPSIVFPGESVNESSLASIGFEVECQLWKFNDLASGLDQEYREYKITSKNSEGSEWDLALVGDTYLTDYGYQVLQDEYCLDDDFWDEWVLMPIRDAYIVGITNTATDHNHTNVLFNVEDELLDGYFDVTRVATSGTTARTIRTYMQNSDLFILHGDGMYDSIGTLMYLNSSGSAYLHSWDIYNYNGNVGIDMSDCELAIFAGCYTANHSTQSLPQAAVDAGAVCAIGFNTGFNCEEIADWTWRFSARYADNQSVSDAAYGAAFDTGGSMDIIDYVIFE